MPRHLIAGQPAPELGGCYSPAPGVSIHRGPNVHFAHCEPNDCFCGRYWGRTCDERGQRHSFVALSKRVVLCRYCQQPPTTSLTRGQLKRARDLHRAEWKRVIAARHSTQAEVQLRRIRRFSDACRAAATDAEREAARERLRLAVDYYYERAGV